MAPLHGRQARNFSSFRTSPPPSVRQKVTPLRVTDSLLPRARGNTAALQRASDSAQTLSSPIVNLPFWLDKTSLISAAFCRTSINVTTSAKRKCQMMPHCPLLFNSGKTNREGLCMTNNKNLVSLFSVHAARVCACTGKRHRIAIKL